MPDAAIVVDRLTHRYRDGRCVLQDVSFHISAGECVGLVGANGAGKTTLLLRLCGVMSGSPGQIQIANLDPAKSADRQQLPRRVGVVFQNPDDQLFSPSLADDVAFGPLNLQLSPDVVSQRTRDALRDVGLPEYGERVPHLLSGGEKRRAALATVLAMQPQVWLLDEPTMFLDPRGRRELMPLLQRLPGTKLITTHDLDFVLEVCPRVLVLDRGRLAADGPSCTILADAELMDRHGLEVPWRLRTPWPKGD